MGQSVMQVRFIGDGRVKITTVGEVAEEHHLKADEMLDFIRAKTGGAHTTEHLKDPALHHHSHGHTHHHHEHRHTL